MATYELLKICGVCGGDGLRPNLVGNTWGDTTCTRCDGVGKYLFGSIDLGDLEDKIDDLLDKCNDILEKVNE
jgi:hypothetical protein